MYRDDDENKLENRAEAVQEEKAEEAQAMDEKNMPGQTQAAVQENYGSTSRAQESYKNDASTQESYKNDTSTQEGYKNDTSAQESYKNNAGTQESYKNDTDTQKGYSSDTPQNVYQNNQQNVYGNHPQNAYGNGQQNAYGNHPQSAYGSSQQSAYGNHPQSSYGSSSQSAYGNRPQTGTAQEQNIYGAGQSGRYGSGQPFSGSSSSYGQPGNAGYHQPNYSGYHPQGSTGYPNTGNAGYQQPDNSSYGRQYAPWQQPQNSSSKDAKKTRAKKPVPPLAKKTAGIVAAALLFGVVAGTTITGVQMLTRSLNPDAAQEQVTLSQAETVPAPQVLDPESKSQVIVTGTNDVSAIVERAMPSVVAINSITQHEVQNWFGQSQIYKGMGSGSGIIVGESETELLLVTNNHVIENTNSLSVSFSDNETAEAHIKGTDSENDLAVLAVSLDEISDDTKSKIAIATLGDSDALKVGQGVIAIGNALGYGQSVTVGYISALDREVRTDEQTTRNLLQTDAAINPGNSGGALLNMQGELIGINSAKYSSTEVEGMGYAIPISKVSSIIDELMTKKTRVQIEQERQGYLGIQGTDIDASTSNLYGMPQGVFVYKIVEGGAAASSDLKEKDIITKFDDQTVRTMAELKNMLIYYAGGDSVELTVQSLKDGEYVERKVTVTLGNRPKEENIH